MTQKIKGKNYGESFWASPSGQLSPAHMPTLIKCTPVYAHPNRYEHKYTPKYILFA